MCWSQHEYFANNIHICAYRSWATVGGGKNWKSLHNLQAFLTSLLSMGMEAAARGVPAVAYAEAGGVVESIADDRTGVIAHDFIDFTTALNRILREKEFRLSLGAAAAQRSTEFTWDSAIKSFEQVLLDAVKRS